YTAVLFMAAALPVPSYFAVADDVKSLLNQGKSSGSHVQRRRGDNTMHFALAISTPGFGHICSEIN
ncbi:MAG: hypothetical protein ACREUY_02295, partial [Burkholderiales bacterium]